jgi:F0F1-type ATP synthase membrane subunit a
MLMLCSALKLMSAFVFSILGTIRWLLSLINHHHPCLILTLSAYLFSVLSAFYNEDEGEKLYNYLSSVGSGAKCD